MEEESGDCGKSVDASREFISGFRRRERNRQSDDAVAELEAELRRAYAVKELQTQILERQASRCVESAQERRAAEVARLREQLASEEDRRVRSESQKRCKEYREQLEEQMTLKEEARMRSLEEARREREVLEEVDRLREEEERSKAMERKAELAERTMRERSILLEIKEIQKQKEQEAEERKKLEDLQYAREVERRAREVERLREEHARRHESVLREIARIIADAESRKAEKEALLFELVAEEVRREFLVREEEERTRRRRMREELVAGLEDQIVFTERCKMRFVEQDRSFAEEVMRKVMQDEKTARLTAEARRRAQARYREDLKALIEERRRVREEEIARIEEALRREERLETLRLSRIAEERKRLLAEHADIVADYVRKRALTDEELTILAESMKGKDGAVKPSNSS